MIRIFLKFFAFTILLFSVSAPIATYAQDTYKSALSHDLIGAKDHPWTGRYSGSTLLLQNVLAFDEITLPAGRAEIVGGKKFAETVTAEGQVTRTVYVVPPGRPSLEVLRNYKNHIQGQGFTEVFQCSGTDGCGEVFKELKYHWSNKTTHVSAGKASDARNRIVSAVFDGGRDIRYSLLRKGSGDEAAYVGLFVAQSEGGTFGDISKALTNHVIALVEVVEPRAMEAQIETIRSETIASSLQSEGAVALYGLVFDVDKAVLKPESEPQLAEMVNYLKSNSVRVYVVGHTDVQGALDYNLELSDRRAKAVVKALIAKGISEDRLIARGVGPLSPTASNSNEDGRSKNRRVELVTR